MSQRGNDISSPVILQMDRLVLRPFVPDDVDDVLASTGDPEWARYLVNIPFPFTRQDAIDFVTRFADLSGWADLPMFTITLEGRAIGEVNLDGIDTVHERAEIGYNLSREHWGKGIAVEAAAGVIDWAFHELNMNRIYATCDVRNTRSVRVMEKLGMIREGLLRQHWKWRNEYRDVLIYGLLRKEWQKGTMDNGQEVRR